MMTKELSVFSASLCQLGEGGCWHYSRESFFWVDILEGKLFEQDIEGSLNQWEFDCFVSAVFEVEDDADHIWVVSAVGLLLLSLEKGDWRVVHPLLGIGGGMRTNDAGIDPSGNLVYGTMHCNPEGGSGAVYRLDKSGVVNLLIDDVRIPNTFQWADDGRTLYSADSHVGVMYQFQYDSGEVTGREQYFVLDSKNGIVPDGSSLDSKGFLWNASWGGAVIQKFDVNGILVEKIALPVSRPTNCVFGDGGRLFVTTARVGLSKDELEKEPLAGSVLLIETGCEGAKKPFLKLDSQ